MEYIICIQTDFGELKVHFETDGVLKNHEEVLKISLEKIGESNDVLLKDTMLTSDSFFEVVEGKTLEDM